MLKAIRKDAHVGSASPSRSRTAGSPTAPVRMATAVIPTCTVDITRTGSSCSLSAAAAPAEPASARDCRPTRRAVTMQYSQTTKNALAAISANSSRMRTESLTRARLPRQREGDVEGHGLPARAGGGARPEAVDADRGRADPLERAVHPRVRAL